MTPVHRASRQQAFIFGSETVENDTAEFFFICQERRRNVTSRNEPTTDNGHERSIRRNGGQSCSVLDVTRSQTFFGQFYDALLPHAFELSETANLTGLKARSQSSIDLTGPAWPGAQYELDFLIL